MNWGYHVSLWPVGLWPCQANIKGKWKLHEYFEDGACELYNLDADPGERINLADIMPKKTDELKAMLTAWREDVNAPVPDQLNPKYDPSFVPAKKNGKKNKKKKR